MREELYEEGVVYEGGTRSDITIREEWCEGMREEWYIYEGGVVYERGVV
jgi:hypothetical protein